MRVITFVIAFLLAILPDSVPAVSNYDATEVCMEEVIDTEEDAIVRAPTRSLKRVSVPSRPVSSGYVVVQHGFPQSSFFKSTEKQRLVSCSLRL